jgi:arsenate reductase
MLTLYGIKNCDSVRKAIKFLKTHGIDYRFVDFRETPVNLETIARWLKHTDIKTLFNTRGTTYRNLKLKTLELDDEARKTWLAKENMLIKRPVIELDDDILVGYNEDRYKEKLL